MPLIPSVVALVCTGCIWLIYDRSVLGRVFKPGDPP